MAGVPRNVLFTTPDLTYSLSMQVEFIDRYQDVLYSRDEDMLWVVLIEEAAGSEPLSLCLAIEKASTLKPAIHHLYLQEFSYANHASTRDPGSPALSPELPTV